MGICASSSVQVQSTDTAVHVTPTTAPGGSVADRTAEDAVPRPAPAPARSPGAGQGYIVVDTRASTDKVTSLDDLPSLSQSQSRSQGQSQEQSQSQEGVHLSAADRERAGSEPKPSLIRRSSKTVSLRVHLPHTIHESLSAPPSPECGSPSPRADSPTAAVVYTASELRERWKTLELQHGEHGKRRQVHGSQSSSHLSQTLESPHRFQRSASVTSHQPPHRPSLTPGPGARRRRRRWTVPHIASSELGASFSDVASYVPTVVIQDFLGAGKQKETHQVLGARATPIEAAVAFVDMSGFTRLTEYFQAMDGGVEAMSRVLNDYFVRLIDVVCRHGGDVVKFAGDALLVMWSSACSKDAQPLAVHAFHALACLQDLHASFCDFEVVPGIRVSLHSAVGAGLLLGAHVGGVGGRWEFILESHEHSPALDNLWAAMDHSKLGDVVLTADVYGLFEQELQSICSLATSAIPDSDCVRLVNLSVDLSRAPTPVPLKRSPVGSNTVSDRLVPQFVTRRLRAYVPKYVSARLDRKLAGWLAELRTLTVVFIKLPRFSLSKPAELAEFQQLLSQIMRICNAQLGAVRQIITDDKGTVVILVFGLESPAEGALLGVRAALLVRRSQSTSMSTRPIFVGLSTGDLFCGNLGSVRRREYVFIGDAVNTAARLMSLAAKKHAAGSERSNCVVICDERTHDAVLLSSRSDERADKAARSWFSSQGEVQLKGKQQPVTVWRPRFAILGTDLATFTPVPADDDKYKLATSVLGPQLEALRSGCTPPLLVLTGSPGHALPTYAVSHLYHRAAAQGALVVTSCAPHSELSSTGFVIGRLVLQCLWLILASPSQEINHDGCGAGCSRNHGQVDEDLDVLFPIVDELVGFIGSHRFFRKRDALPTYTKSSPLPMPADLLLSLALLNGVVPGLALPVAPSLAALSSQQRERAITGLIGQLLCFAATQSSGSVQVIVDSAEYTDAFSIATLLDCVRSHSSVRLVLCVRGFPQVDVPLVHALQHVSFTSVLDGDGDLTSWLPTRAATVGTHVPMLPMRSVSGRRHRVQSHSPSSPVTPLPKSSPHPGDLVAGCLWLQPLDRHAVERAIAQQLGVLEVDPRVVQLCHEDSCGSLDNLVFLVSAHVQAGDIVVDPESSTCTLDQRFAAYTSPLPGFVSLGGGVRLAPELSARVASFLQAIGPTHLMVLKSAALFGHFFTRELLLRVFPVEDDQQRSRLPRLLDELALSRVIKVCGDSELVAAKGLLGGLLGDDVCYRFAEWPIQAVLYEGLPREYRTKLHVKVARCVMELLEQLPDMPGTSRLYLYRLATFHWSRTPVGLSTTDLMDASSCAALSTSADLVQDGDLDLVVNATWSGRYVLAHVADGDGL